MIKTTLSVLALAASLGVAHAQSIETNPARLQVDHRATHIAGGSAGTVGAMEAYVFGVATSPQDVALQQDGRAPAAEGAQLVDGAKPVENAGYGPGTVGAAPGR